MNQLVQTRRILLFRERLSGDLCHTTKKNKSSSNKAKLEDKTLLEKAKLNHEFFGALYAKYKDKIFHYILYRVNHDVETAEDLTQESFIRAFNALDHFQYQNCTYLAYLMTIAHNLLVNYYRSHKTISLDRMLYLPQDAIVESQNESQIKLDMDVLWNFVKHLSRQEQEVMKLKYQKDASIKSIATQLNKTPNAIKIILSRARKKLKKKCEACVKTTSTSV